MSLQGRWFQNRFSLASYPSRPLAVTVSLVSLAMSIAGPSWALPVTPAVEVMPATKMAQVGMSIVYVNSALGQDGPTSGKTAATPLKTISYALQQAEPGTTIQLASGSYTAQGGEVFPLILRPGVTLPEAS